MDKGRIPRWQQELRSFIGIKSGIILEGNVYDEFPIFDFSGPEPVYSDIDNMDAAVASLVDENKTRLFFFDPVNGFYLNMFEDIENQRQILSELTDGFSCEESFINHGCTLCMMPRSSNRSEEGELIAFSRIIRDCMCSGTGRGDEMNYLFVLNFASRLESCNSYPAQANTMFLNLMVATTTPQPSQLSCSGIIMRVDKYNDIPAWLYLNNPNIRTVSVAVPDRAVRRLFLENLYGALSPFQLLSRENYQPGRQFIAETEGLQLQELRQILRLAYKMDIKPDNISQAFRLYKYGVSENPWENMDPDILERVESKLKERVKGQDEALSKLMTVVKRAVKGLSGLQHSGSSHKPKGALFFAGPTGVGKTETAKALAEALFFDENACIRFDMSEYRQDQSDQKLFGAPPGYVGYEGGGQLTNAVKNRPFSIILFDEIEKACPSIMDKFLQILEDGRMTDNQGDTVYFGECIIIFTSNIGLTKEDPAENNFFRENRHRVPSISIENPEKEDSKEFRAELSKMLTKSVEDYFTDMGRPEILNRLGKDNIVVFQFINVEDAKCIAEYKLKKICSSIEKEKNIHIIVDDVMEDIKKLAVSERGNGGRGIGNMLEREFLNPLAGKICALKDSPRCLRCHMNSGKIEFEVMDGDT